MAYGGGDVGQNGCRIQYMYSIYWHFEKSFFPYPFSQPIDFTGDKFTGRYAWKCGHSEFPSR
jgi:hypothetical protein